MITGRADTGGGPEHIFQLVQYLRSECTVIIAAPRQEPYWERFKSIVSPSGMLAIPPRTVSLRSLVDLHRVVQGRAVDIVHSHGRPAAIYASLLRAIAGTPVVHTPNGAFAHGPIKGPVYRLLDLACSMQTKHLIAVSETEEIELRRLLQRNSGISTIRNGIAFDFATRTRGFAKSPRRVLHVTRFVHQKNSGELLRIMEVLHSMGLLSRFHFDVVGDGPGRTAFESEIKSRNLSRAITCHGAQATIFPFLAESFAILSTSRWEGLPFAILEAMSMGVPPIASSVTGNMDIVTPEVGLLFALGDHEQAAAHLLSLEEKLQWDRLSASSMEMIATSYSAKGMASKVAALYTDILKE